MRPRTVSGALRRLKDMRDELGLLAGSVGLLALVGLAFWPLLSGGGSGEESSEEGLSAARRLAEGAMPLKPSDAVLSDWRRKDKPVQPGPDKIRLPGDEDYDLPLKTAVAPAQPAPPAPIAQEPLPDPRKAVQDAVSRIAADSTRLVTNTGQGVVGDFSQLGNPSSVSIGMASGSQARPASRPKAESSGPIMDIAAARAARTDHGGIPGRRFAGMVGASPLRDALGPRPISQVNAAVQGAAAGAAAAPAAQAAQAPARVNAGFEGAPQGDTAFNKGGAGNFAPVAAAGGAAGGGGGAVNPVDPVMPLSMSEIYKRGTELAKTAKDYNTKVVAKAASLEREKAGNLRYYLDGATASMYYLQNALLYARYRYSGEALALLDRTYAAVGKELLPRLTAASSGIGGALSGLDTLTGCGALTTWSQDPTVLGGWNVTALETPVGVDPARGLSAQKQLETAVEQADSARQLAAELGPAASDEYGSVADRMYSSQDPAIRGLASSFRELGSEVSRRMGEVTSYLPKGLITPLPYPGYSAARTDCLDGYDQALNRYQGAYGWTCGYSALPASVDPAALLASADDGYKSVKAAADKLKADKPAYPKVKAADDMVRQLDSAVLDAGAASEGAANAGKSMASLARTGESAVLAYSDLCDAKALSDTAATSSALKY